MYHPRTPLFLEARNLRLHAAIAQRLRERPELFDRARETLQRWRGASSPNPCWAQWESLLEDRERCLEVLTERSDRAQRPRAGTAKGLALHARAER